jgi:hypothetical protein
MTPVIVKLIGAAVGTIFADIINKKLTAPKIERNKEVLQAKSGPTGAENDVQNAEESGSNRNNQRSDRLVSDQPIRPTNEHPEPIEGNENADK